MKLSRPHRLCLNTTIGTCYLTRKTILFDQSSFPPVSNLKINCCPVHTQFLTISILLLLTIRGQQIKEEGKGIFNILELHIIVCLYEILIHSTFGRLVAFHIVKQNKHDHNFLFIQCVLLTLLSHVEYRQTDYSQTRRRIK